MEVGCTADVSVLLDVSSFRVETVRERKCSVCTSMPSVRPRGWEQTRGRMEKSQRLLLLLLLLLLVVVVVFVILLVAAVGIMLE